jgi:para-aminobenzoate synthetase component 1
VAKPGSVKVDELCGVYPFPNVMQMVSTVSCELKDNIGWAEPVRCSFPMGSMTGAPKQKALELIEIFEKVQEAFIREPLVT